MVNKTAYHCVHIEKNPAFSTIDNFHNNNADAVAQFQEYYAIL